MPDVASALVCGNYTCAPAGTWVTTLGGIDVKSAGVCRDVDGVSYCAASAIRCSVGHYADKGYGCETTAPTVGYWSRYGSCFTLICNSCMEDTGHSYATSVAGEAQNICSCYLPTQVMYQGVNGYYDLTTPCSYTDVCLENYPAIEYSNIPDSQEGGSAS